MDQVRSRRISSVAAAVCLFLGAAGSTLSGAEPAKQACTDCHDQGSKLAKSAHADLACDSCHESHDQYPHKPNIPKPECATCHADQASEYNIGVHGLARKSGNEGAPDCALCHGSAHELLPTKSQAFRTAVPDTCGMCHTDVAAQYRASVHGQAMARGITQAPLCTDCHGEHNIIKHTNAASPVNAMHIRDTCGSCHGDVRLDRKFGLPSDRLVSFDSSFHGLAAKAGIPDRGQLRQLPRCPQYSAVVRPEIHHQRQEPAQNLRPVPSRRRDPFRHQPGARGAGRPNRPPLRIGAPVLSAADSRNHRADAAAQRRRLDPQADPCAFPDGSGAPRRGDRAPGWRNPHAALRARATRRHWRYPSWSWSGPDSP